MLIAQKLKRSNRAEHLLYLWQVEDMMRAFQLDTDRINAEYLSRFDLSPEERAETEKWYANICEMMKSEGLREKGHLQIHKNLLAELEETHARLMKSTEHPDYRTCYYKVLPYIVELRAKGEDPNASELQVCFDVLYGVWLLKLQKKNVSPETLQATQDISAMLARLSDAHITNN